MECGISPLTLVVAFASRPLVVGDRIGPKFSVYLSSIICNLVMFMGRDFDIATFFFDNSFRRIICRHLYLDKCFLSREFSDTTESMTREVQR